MQGKLMTAVLCILAVSASAQATPTITSLTGSATQGAMVTISGSGFGTKNPVAPLMWDPVYGQPGYAGLVNGSVIPKGSGFPWPVMSGSGTTPPTYKTTNPRGKILANYSNELSNYSGMGVVGNVDYSTYCNRSLGGTGKLYVSWWMYPYNYDYTSKNFYPSDKFIRITPKDQWSTAAYIFVAQGQAQLYDFSLGYLGNKYFDPRIKSNSWNRLEYVVDNTTTPRPRVKASTNQTLVSDMTAASPGFSVDLCGIADLGADYSNDTAPITMDFGEIYVDSTPARVEVCDGATFAGSTHCEIQIPQNTWSDSTIQINVNQGTFADKANVYLYVIDANGVASSGKQITMGGVLPASNLKATPQ